jgi:phosphoribosylaminoimidazole-succinocarboxamide synthase
MASSAQTSLAANEAGIKAKIREHLQLTLPECFIPELGESKKGKVRDIYFSGENVVMVTNDRVSAFDFILPNLIPFKGQVLNMISEWAFSQTKDIIPNALVQNVDDSVVMQKKMKNLNVEWIVRGYLWGSMAAAYEKGDRTFCGLSVADGLNRFQKFDTPLFTPTTKAEVGHDENMTMDEVEKLLGRDMAAKAKDAAMKLYQRGSELMRKQGLILIDTKYEFGVDEKGVLHVIDEVNTPDSSRMCTVEEWETKYPKIAAEMATGKYKTVTEVLAVKPELKLKEFSKQYVRDALLELGFNPAKDQSTPKLSDEQVIECSFRYIKIYEQVTGKTFEFPSTKMLPTKRIVMNLQRAGLIKGAFVLIAAGSDSDMPHLESLRKELAKFKIPAQIRICSAHKQPGRLESIIAQYNKSTEPIMMVGCAGGTDALSGTASYLAKFPVVSCPPDGMNNTCLTNPPGSSNAFIVKPSNVGKFAAQFFAHSSEEIAATLEASIAEKITKLEQADEQLLKKQRLA